MRQRKLGSHTPPCHRRMVITTLFSVLLAALQRRPVLYHTRWLLTVHRHWSSGHLGQLAPTTHPQCRLVSNPCPAVTGGGGGFGMAAWAPRPYPPPTPTHIRKVLLGKYMKFIKGARNGGSILGTQTFFLASDPPPRGVLNGKGKKKCSGTSFPQKARGHSMCSTMVGGGWRLAAVGGWRLVAVGGWRLMGVGGWWLVVPWGGP